MIDALEATTRRLTLDRRRPTLDRRIPTLERLIEDPRTAVVSVDCFDTILWRRTAKPTDVFVVLGEELRDGGQLNPGLDPRAFCQLRTAAEATARLHKHGREQSYEVSLADIYAELPAHISDLSQVELAAREVSLERRLVVPDFELCEALSRLTEGLALIVVSDTYLSSAQLTALLDQPGFGALRDALVFTSCDFGTGKEAELWDLLPPKLGVAPEQIVHVGNNRRADYLKPAAAGVRALHWAETSSSLPAVIEREVDFRPDGERDWGTDNGVTALRGRARFRPYDGPPQHEPAWQAGVELLGPVMVGYSDWVFERTAALGIDRAICVMREGRFFKQLIDAGVADSANPGLRSGLLWASRTALSRVLLADASQPEFEQALLEPRPASIAGAAELLGVSLEQYPQFAALARQAPHLAEDRNALQLFLDAVWRTPGALAHAQQTARRRRANFLAHLRDVIGEAPGPLALLDIGWQGSNQERLQKIIDGAGLDVRLHGFYVSADTTPVERLLRGHQIEGFVPGRPIGSDRRQPAFFRNRVMLETLFLSGDGSTLEIGDDGRPVFGPNRPSAAQAAMTQAFQDGILAYRQHVADYRTSGAGSEVGRISGRAARTLLERFVTAPTRAEAELFGPIVHDDSHSNMESVSLIPSVRDRWARRLSPAQLHDERWERVWWAAGAAALWQHSAAPGIPADMSPAGMLRVELRRRDQAGVETQNVLLRLGADGTSVGSLRAVGNDLHNLRLFPGITPGLLRLDGIELFLATPSNGWRQRIWSWSAGDARELLTVSDGQWIAPDILSVGPQTCLEIALGQPLPLPSHFQLEFRAGFLPMVDGASRLKLQDRKITINFEPVTAQ